MKRWSLFPILLLLLLAAGCLGPKAEYNKGNLEDFEFEQFRQNTVTFYLNDQTMYHTVNWLEGTSTLALPIPETMMEDKFKFVNDIVVVDPDGEEWDYTTNLEEDHLEINFEGLEKGFIGYKESSFTDKRTFMHDFPEHADYVRVVLPQGYHYRDLLFGKVNPEPSEEFIDNNGRLHLVWYERTSVIMVKYYPINNPTIFYFLLLIIAAIGAVIAVKNNFMNPLWKEKK